jgi:hypothetical protein
VAVILGVFGGTVTVTPVATETTIECGTDAAVLVQPATVVATTANIAQALKPTIQRRVLPVSTCGL